ncbi:hypothetical protein [Adlercreutzia murintestinalis]|uniref:hypothetical protein n=1 Tax=Adlercreutzia murintestinalis TaxID=2941325 RepID=UPI00203E728A|nr:hypothetical protein [Adlercreutzia murintestinalis]
MPFPKTTTLPINALYPLRIIGLNQDTRADGKGMAGLTFMFRQPTSETYRFKDDGDTSSSIYGTTVGRFLREGGALCDSVKNVLVSVQKKQLEASLTGTAGQEMKSFILSLSEIGYAVRSDGHISDLGVGKNRNEIYLGFSSQGYAFGEGDKVYARILHDVGATYTRDLFPSGYDFQTGYSVHLISNTPSFLNISRSIAPSFCL